MCLILASYQNHSKYPLIVAANRDEFYQRPTKHTHFWEDKPSILAGRDLEKGGTWMGVTRSGYFAALTNYRDLREDVQGKRSRGEIVTKALESEKNLIQYMQSLKTLDSQYPGYNLLAGNLDYLYYYSNISKNLEILKPGIYGLSNHLLNTDWPKVKKGKVGLSQIIKEAESDKQLIDLLFNLLQTTDKYPDQVLPNTGVSLEMERMLSPLFIQSPQYGTRSSTVLLMNEKELVFIERIFVGEPKGEKRFYLHL